jgi:hypothetical protein
MARAVVILVLSAALAAQVEAAQANPIRKVVTMLQMMSKKVEAEGEKEQKNVRRLYVLVQNWRRRPGEEHR